MKRFVTIILLLTGALVLGSEACGGDNNPGTDGGGQDGTLSDVAVDGGPTTDACWNGCTGDSGPPLCAKVGFACQTGGDCCSGACTGGACQLPPCTSDNGACTSSGACCSGTCGTGGTCTPLNIACKTLGNACAAPTDCCSGFCQNNVCAQPSYCGQNGDVCTQGSDCCGGVCTKQPNAALGICAQPSSGGCTIDGMLCGGGTVTYTDGGLPSCGGSCCSRSCAPWGPNSVLVCQPASGCHPAGDVCVNDVDCCGGWLGQTTCNKASPTDKTGVCGNPTGCKPNGDICRLQTNQCNATDNCCSGNVQQYDTCHQDNLGIPRCSYAGDAGCIPPAADAGCSSSADCCNLNPCVPNPSDAGPPYTCYPQTCVPTSGPCTTDGDCCPGGHCYIQNGQSSGSCIAPPTDAGTDASCALYGQTCAQSSDCCNGVPCTNGRCEVPQPL
ncbi:MAG TPA: hypothetical protein VLM85_15835 [Polyangiaceae bacterium]|nr:hypothetical protein [Polyangiaceae bacterium]